MYLNGPMLGGRFWKHKEPQGLDAPGLPPQKAPFIRPLASGATFDAEI